MKKFLKMVKSFVLSFERVLDTFWWNIVSFYDEYSLTIGICILGIIFLPVWTAIETHTRLFPTGKDEIRSVILILLGFIVTFTGWFKLMYFLAKTLNVSSRVVTVGITSLTVLSLTMIITPLFTGNKDKYYN
jgi:hypothetical protein